MNRQEKAETASELKEKFLKAKGVVLTDYSGLTVADLYELRKQFGKGLQFKVAKNTLARKASEDTPMSVAADRFKGQVGLAIGYDDPVAVIKKVMEFSKKNEKLKMGVGVLEGKLYERDELKRIAALPPREVLLSTLAGVMQAPTGKLASGLNQTLVRFAYALGAFKEKKAAGA